MVELNLTLGIHYIYDIASIALKSSNNCCAITDEFSIFDVSDLATVDVAHLELHRDVDVVH